MSKDVDCQVFEDQLDALVMGTLPEEGRRQLRLHAETCPECAMQVRVQEHLVLPSLEELEARVPEALLASMWSRVEEKVKEEVGAAADGAAASADQGRSSAAGWGGERRGEIRPRFGWLVPALAAATLILFFSTGFLFHELGRVRDREAILAQQVVEQQRWLAELDVGPSADPVARTAALAGRNPWLRALSRQETISVQGLRTLLERMPSDRMVMSRGQLDAAVRSRTLPLPPPLREALRGLEGREGARARDVLRALDEMELSPDLRLPTTDLMRLLS